MKRWEEAPLVGELRPSQMIFTYGPGAIVELPNMAAIVMGTQAWDYRQFEEVSDPRLLRAVQERLREGHEVERLLALSAKNTRVMSGSEKPAVQVPVYTFPSWLRCTRCNLLARIDSGLFEPSPEKYRTDRAMYRHVNCRNGSARTVPPPYLVACPRGHLDDFPWSFFVHRGPECAQPTLELRQAGSADSVTNVFVRCRGCNAKDRPLADAYGESAREAIGTACTGRRPHLNDFDADGCGAEPRTVVVGASNLWFPETLSTIYLPQHQDPLREQIRLHWGAVEKLSDPARLQIYREDGLLPLALEQYTDTALMAEIAAIRAERQAPVEGEALDLLSPEWEAFTHPERQINPLFLKLREVPCPVILQPLVRRIVVAERLIEIRATVGFTRIEAPIPAQEEPNATAPLMPVGQASLKWVPASQVRGEGMFLQFDETTLRQALARPAIIARDERLLEAHRLWRRNRQLPPETGFPGMRYVLLHTIAHALIRQFALTCGYATASLRERIYCQAAEAADDAMAGILIYTSAPDSEGTLGGLISLATPEVLEEQVAELLASLEFCSADPLCAEHTPDSDHDLPVGAACHACLYLPETSCERGNRYLDRTSLLFAVEE